MVSLLEQEALITRNEKKEITAVDWPKLINRWVTDYSVSGSNRLSSYIEPRGLRALAPKMERITRYALTGSLGAPSIVAPPRLAIIYVEDAGRAAQKLELTPTEAGTNVWLLEPYDDVVFERTRRRYLFFDWPGPGGSNAPAVAGVSEAS